jgi:hypothetical protein
MVMALETTNFEWGPVACSVSLTTWVCMFYFMESATIIIFFTTLIHFQGGEGGCEKEYCLYACDNDEKDGRPLNNTDLICWWI